MVEEELPPSTEELELEGAHKQPSYDLIKKCLYDPSLSIERTRACRDLAYECHKNMKTELSAEERKDLRQRILNETAFKHDVSPRKPEEGSTAPTEVEIDKKKFVVPVRESTILDYGADAERYIKDKQKEPFGYCSLAMYGIENQYYDIINDTPMQPKKQADYIEQAERLIFQENIEYTETHDYGKLWDDMDFKKKQKILDKIPNVDPSVLNVRVPLYKIDDKSVISFIQDDLNKNTDWKELDKLYPNRHYSDLYVGTSHNDFNQKKCDPLDYNPFVEPGKYRYCTEADFTNKQTIKIEKKNLIEMAHLAPRIMEHANSMTFQELWKYVPKETREYIVKRIINIATPSDEAKAITGNLDNVSITTLNDIWHALFTKYKPEELLKTLEDLPAQYDWTRSGDLPCWHNQIEYFYTEAAIEKRIEDLTELLNKGEIEYEYYETEVKKLNDIAKVVSTESPMTPPPYFVQKSSYMPMRHRMHFSQSAIDSILQYKIYFPSYVFNYNNLSTPDKKLYEPISDEHTIDFIESSFNEKEVQQMEHHKFFTDDQISRIKFLADYDLATLWNLLTPYVKSIVDNEFDDADLIENWITIEKDLLQNPSSLLEGSYNIFALIIKELKIPVDTIAKYVDVLHEGEKLMLDNVIVDKNTYYANYTYELEPDNLKDTAKIMDEELRGTIDDVPEGLEGRPLITETEIQQIFVDNDETTHTFDINYPYSIIINYDRLEQIVGDRIQEMGGLGEIKNIIDFNKTQSINKATRALAEIAKQINRVPFQKKT